MGETKDASPSQGEEKMHLDNPNDASNLSEIEQQKSEEEEARIESVELEGSKNEASEEKSTVTPKGEDPSERSESGENPVKSGEDVTTQKTQLENCCEVENKNENGDGSMGLQEEIPCEGGEEPEKSQLQFVLVNTGGDDPMGMEISNEKDNSDNGAGQEEGDGDGHASNYNFDYWSDGDDSGTEEEQLAFMNEIENFYKENDLEFKPPKFYGEGLNLLKLWRQTTRFGCYEKVTSQKLWRQVGEAFNPPKTCTTVSWTFRIFYEKALLEYEKHKIRTGQLHAAMPELPLPLVGNEGGSGRARRDAAARAMEGWHSQRVLGNGEIADAIIKGKSTPSKDKLLKSSGSAKRKKPCTPDRNDNRLALIRVEKPQLDISIVDDGPPADWVKINVKKLKDCYEVYALVPGLLREEVQVKLDPSGRLIVSGEPEQPDNPWGVTPFKKVITLPSSIDPHNTSAVVTLHGQLLVRVPFPANSASNK